MERLKISVWCGSCVGWHSYYCLKSSTQKCVTMTICETMYVTLCDAPKEALFTRTVLVFLQPRHLWCDNESSKAAADNPSTASRSKYVDVKPHFIRGLVRDGKIRILHVGTEEQHAHVLTKALWRNTFLVHRVALIYVFYAVS